MQIQHVLTNVFPKVSIQFYLNIMANQTQLIIQQPNYIKVKQFYCQELMDQTVLVQIFSRCKSTSCLCQHKQVISNLKKLLELNDLQQFETYLLTQSSFTPVIMLDVANLLISDQRGNKILGQRISKFYLRYKMYISLKIHTQNAGVQRKNVSQAFERFDFNGSNISDLVADCLKSIDKKMDVSQIVKQITSERKKQINQLFDKIQELEPPAYHKTDKQSLDDMIADFRAYPEGSLQRHVQKEMILSFTEKCFEDKSILRKQVPQLQNLKTELEQIFTNKLGLITSDIKEILQKIKENKAKKQKQKLYENICLLKYKIVPINVLELQRLIEKTKESEQLIFSKDVLFFIGNTGSGKSTTILKFLGYTLRKGFFRGLSTLIPVQQLETRHTTFYTSPEAKSCTRYINAVLIPNRIYGAKNQSKQQQLFICDSPGFGDSGGVQIDIANGVGMINALHGARSVKIVAVLSYGQIVEIRMAELVKISQVISNLFISKPLLQSIMFLFNRTPEEKITEVPRLIQSRITNLTEVIKANQNCLMVLNQILQQSKNRQNYIDPLKSDFQNILQKIFQMKLISDVKDCLKYQLTSGTKNQISRYTQILRNKIKDFLLKQNFNEAQFHLGLLKKLKNIFTHDDKIGQYYKQLIQMVEEITARYFKTYQFLMESLINSEQYRSTKVNQVQLKTKIGQLQILKKKIHEINIVFKDFDQIKLVSEQIIVQTIEDNKQKIKMQCQDLLNVTSNNIHTMKDFSSIFCPNLKDIIGVFYTKKFNQFFQMARKQLPENKFKQMKPNVEMLKKLQQLTKQIYSTPSIDMSNNRLKKLKDPLTKKVQQAFAQIQNFRKFSGSEISMKTIASLKANMNIVKQIEQLKYIDKSNNLLPRLNRQLNSIEQRCKKKINDIYNLKLSLDMSDKQSFDKNQIITIKSQIELLMKIQNFQQKFIQRYQYVIENIRVKIKNNLQSVNKFIQTLKTKKIDEIITKMNTIKNSIKIVLQCYLIMDQKQDRSKIVASIQQQFCKVIEDEKKQIKFLQVNLSRISQQNLKNIQNFYTKIKAYCEIDIIGQLIVKQTSQIKRLFLILLKKPFIDYRQHLNKFVKEGDSYKLFQYNLSQLQKLSFYIFKMEQILSLEDYKSMMQNEEFKRLSDICDQISKDAHKFIITQFDLNNRYQYLQQLIKVLVKIKLKPYCLKYLITQMKFDANSNLDYIAIKLQKIKIKIQQKLKTSQNSIVYLQEILAICKFYCQIQGSFDQSNNFGFTELTKKYQAKFFQSLKNDQQRIIQLIVGYKPTKISFNELKIYYERFKSLQNQDGRQKINIMVSQLNKVQQQLLSDLKKFRGEIEDRHLANSKAKIADFLEIYWESQQLQRQLTNLYTIEEDRNRIEINKEMLQSIKGQINEYYSEEYSELMRYVQDCNIVNMKQKSKKFSWLENIVFKAFHIKQQYEEKIKAKSSSILLSGLSSRLVDDVEHFISSTSNFLRQKIAAHTMIRQQQKNKANKSRKLGILLSILIGGIQTEVDSKYNCNGDNTNNFTLDKGFAKYYDQASQNIKNNLKFNASNLLKCLYKQYENKFNTSRDQAERIQKDIKASIQNLPKQIRLDASNQFQGLKMKFLSINMHDIQQKGRQIMRSASHMEEFIKKILESKQNNQTQFYLMQIKELSQKYDQLSDKSVKLQQKIKFIQDYFIEVFKSNGKLLKLDDQLLQTLKSKLQNVLNLLNRQAVDNINELKTFFNIFIRKNNNASIDYQSLIVNIFKIYNLFLRVPNQIIKNQRTKQNFRDQLSNGLKQCIIVFNTNIQRRPNFKINSQQILDAKKFKDLKQYISKIRQIGQIMDQIENQLRNIQITERRQKMESLLSKLSNIKEYRPILQSYVHQLQQVKRFVSQYNFQGDKKRMLDSKKLEEDLDRLNLFYSILKQKQEDLGLLLKRDSFIFQRVEKQIDGKFDSFARSSYNEIQQIFQSVRVQQNSKVNLLLSQLEILNKKKKEISFIKKSKVSQTLKKTQQKIKQQTVKVEQKCNKILEQTKKQFKTIEKQLKATIQTENKQIKKVIEQQCKILHQKKNQIQTKYLQTIKQESDENAKKKLQKQLNTELISITNQSEDKKKQMIEQVQTKFKEEKQNCQATIQKVTNKLTQQLVILQNVIVVIVYEVQNNKKLLSNIVQDIKKADPNLISYVQKNLETIEAPQAKILLQTQPTFANHKIMMINKLIKGQDINYVVSHLERITLNGRQKIKEAELKDILNKYAYFKEKYQKHKNNYQRVPSESTIDSMIGPLKTLGTQIKSQFYWARHPKKSSNKKIEILAGIFALWAIMKSELLTGTVTFTIQPHPTQITTLFLLLGIIHPDENLSNRLAQVGTGQGKSIVLAGLSCYLALVGFKVRCACYSTYLSIRDQQMFRQLFQRLGVLKDIKYGTFNQLCENILNCNDQNLKVQMKNMILSSQAAKFNQLSSTFVSNFNSLKKSTQSHTILVVDQVDVFFQDSFFGKSYCPGVNLKGEEVTKVIEHVWITVQAKGQRATPQQIIKSQVFQNLVNKFPTLKRLLQNQIHGMIVGALNYKHDYHIFENKICYKDGDEISNKINYGYKTVFANMYQFHQNKISRVDLDESLQISLMVASFSYAQLPSFFQNILGVTGTLQVLPQYKKKQLLDRYKIKDQYAIPSAFGINKKRVETYQIVRQVDHDDAIIAKIKQVKDSRPIIIFFKGPTELNQFANSPNYHQFLNRTYNLTEYHNVQIRDSRILTAVNPNRITLISSSFGRGTDFILFDDKIKQNGGLHVIQAFLSLEESEEMQIKGRTARQNSKGSYDCVLSQDWLEQLAIQPNQIPLNSLSQNIHKHLLKAREKYIQNLSKNTLELLQSADKRHEAVFQILTKNKLAQADLVNYVQQLNYYPLLQKTVIKTVLGLDGTGSMQPALTKICLIIGDAFERTYAVLKQERAEATIEVKIKVFRNYNAPAEKILQQTAFQTTQVNLKRFLSSIVPEFGWKNQAIEVLFQSLNKEAEIDQVFLIGDSPPNTADQMRMKRGKRGQNYWTQNEFPLTDIDKQLESFVLKDCPVHSFYLNKGDGFIDISKKTGGIASPFLINSPQVTKDLTAFIVENILRIIGKKLGIHTLVDTYRRIYA